MVQAQKGLMERKGLKWDRARRVEGGVQEERGFSGLHAGSSAPVPGLRTSRATT